MVSWKNNKSKSLDKRFEFKNYEDTRLFLEKLEGLSKETGLYPDISFGKTYVNLTIRPSEDSECISQKHVEFSIQVDSL